MLSNVALMCMAAASFAANPGVSDAEIKIEESAVSSTIAFIGRGVSGVEIAASKINRLAASTAAKS